MHMAPQLASHPSACAQVSVLNRDPEEVLAFAEEVALDFAFESIVPCHFDAPIAATPQRWLDAFGFLRKKSGAPVRVLTNVT